MKKYILFTLFFAQISFMLAQSLVVTGETSLTGDPNIQVAHHLDIKNTSSSTITVKCQKTNLSLPSGAASNYCFAGACYSSTSTNPSNPADILAGQLISFNNTPPDTDAHSGYYDAYGVLGIAQVEYCFYDVNNPTDETCVVITYDCSTATGLNDHLDRNSMGDFYPNPANKLTSFAFNGVKGELKVIDILGNEVKVIQLQDSGIKKIDLAGMNKGIYFGNLVINNRVTSIKKLIVR